MAEMDYIFHFEEKNYKSRKFWFSLSFLACMLCMLQGLRRILSRVKSESILAQAGQLDVSRLLLNQFCVYASAMDHAGFFSFMACFNHLLPGESIILFPFVLVTFLHVIIVLNLVYLHRD